MMIPDGGYLAPLVYALIALVLFGGGAFAASRRAKETGARGPGPIISLLIWLALIALVAVLWFGVQVWGGLFGLIS